MFPDSVWNHYLTCEGDYPGPPVFNIRSVHDNPASALSIVEECHGPVISLTLTGRHWIKSNHPSAKPQAELLVFHPDDFVLDRATGSRFQPAPRAPQPFTPPLADNSRTSLAEQCIATEGVRKGMWTKARYLHSKVVQSSSLFCGSIPGFSVGRRGQLC